MGRACSFRPSFIAREGSDLVPISWEREEEHQCASGFASSCHEGVPRVDTDIELLSYITLLYLKSKKQIG